MFSYNVHVPLSKFLNCVIAVRYGNKFRSVRITTDTLILRTVTEGSSLASHPFMFSITAKIQASFYSFVFKSVKYLLSTMTRRKSQLENILTVELIDEKKCFQNLKKNTDSKLSELIECSNDFSSKNELASSDLSVSRWCNELLFKHIGQLERNYLT